MADPMGERHSDPEATMPTILQPDAVLVEAEIGVTATEDPVGVHRSITDDDILLYRHEYDQRERRAKRVDLALLVLFLLMVVFFVLLAFRTENQDQKLSQGLYASCLQRQATAQQYNIGREALVQLAVNSPTAPKDPVLLAKMMKQLRDGLLLPVESCGEPPQ